MIVWYAMVLTVIVKIIKCTVASFIGAIAGGLAFGLVGVLAGLMIGVVDELLIHKKLSKGHYLTYTMTETAFGNMIGIQINRMIDEKLVSYLSGMQLQKVVFAVSVLILGSLILV